MEDKLSYQAICLTIKCYNLQPRDWCHVITNEWQPRTALYHKSDFTPQVTFRCVFHLNLEAKFNGVWRKAKTNSFSQGHIIFPLYNRKRMFLLHDIRIWFFSWKLNMNIKKHIYYLHSNNNKRNSRSENFRKGKQLKHFNLPLNISLYSQNRIICFSSHSRF